MGSEVEARQLDAIDDVRGHAHLADILCLSRPDLVRDIHVAHLRAGADAVETNSFSAAPARLGEVGLTGRAGELNRRAAEIAREAVELCAVAGRPGFVLGAVGPGTRFPSRGEIAVETLTQGYSEQCRGLLAGGVDAILIETCQDLAQIEAAIDGARRAGAGGEVPIFVQVSTEASGGLLLGADLAAVAELLRAQSVPLFGLNCATGPEAMAAPLGRLAAQWDGFLSVQPSAGLPIVTAGRAHYPLGPDAFTMWQERFVGDFGANLIGGCCGTDAAHIAALDAMLRRRAADGWRPQPLSRSQRAGAPARRR
jgi:5-methyltetrahydrofolate--homocysteine methyltransferase